MLRTVASIWGRLSNIDFGEAASTSYEMDLYAGFGGTAGEIDYDVGYIYYAYPDAADDIGFGEVYGSLLAMAERVVTYLMPKTMPPVKKICFI